MGAEEVNDAMMIGAMSTKSHDSDGDDVDRVQSKSRPTQYIRTEIQLIDDIPLGQGCSARRAAKKCLTSSAMDLLSGLVASLQMI